MKGSTAITYKDIILAIDFDYTPGRPGVRTLPNGDPGYPDEPDELDIEDIRLAGSSVYELLSLEVITSVTAITLDKLQNY